MCHLVGGHLDPEPTRAEIGTDKSRKCHATTSGSGLSAARTVSGAMKMDAVTPVLGHLWRGITAISLGVCKLRLVRPSMALPLDSGVISVRRSRQSARRPCGRGRVCEPCGARALTGRCQPRSPTGLLVARDPSTSSSPRSRSTAASAPARPTRRSPTAPRPRRRPTSPVSASPTRQRTRRRLYCYRAAPRAASATSRPRIDRLRGHDGQRTRCAWSVVAYNLDTHAHRRR